MKKLVYIVSDIDKAFAFEWISRTLKNWFQLVFIVIGKKDSALLQFLNNNQIRSYHISNKTSLILQWLSVLKILWLERAVIVHTHMWTANLLGLTTAWLLNIEKRIFTRHHAMTHHVEYPSGLKWDKVCNWLATDIIAVSENIEKILIKYDRAPETKIQIIHHGFDLEYFHNIDDTRVSELRKKHGIRETTFPVIGIIARYIKWKGIQFTIDAFKQIKNQFPQAHLVLANANGDNKSEIQSILSELPKGSYTEIEFEQDLSALYKLFDIYVHVPIDNLVEAFGQTYVEALAAGVPSVFTLSGIAKEFIIDQENALVVDYKNSEEIADAIRQILLHDDVRLKLIKNGRSSVHQFNLNDMLNRLVTLYD